MSTESRTRTGEESFGRNDPLSKVTRWIETGLDRILEGPDRWPNRWDEVYSREGIPADLQHPFYGFDYITSKFQRGGSENVLDVAMGPGRHALPLAERGLKVHGFDLSRKALDLACEQLSRRNLSCSLTQADMFGTYPYAENIFDSVIAIQAIYHGYPPHMQAAIGEIYRVLRPGGVFAFTVSMDRERAMMGARKYIYDEAEGYPNTFIPKAGRERGIPHYYPDEHELEAMLRPAFNNIEMFVDMDHKYRLVTCISN
jgi:SAM-dependent methyltransferase